MSIAFKRALGLGRSQKLGFLVKVISRTDGWLYFIGYERLGFVLKDFRGACLSRHAIKRSLKASTFSSIEFNNSKESQGIREIYSANSLAT